MTLKRGQPVAELGPAVQALARYPQMDLQGTVSAVGDIVGPVLPECDWGKQPLTVVLLDTHVLVWWLNDRTQRSAGQRNVVETGAGG